MLVARLYRPPGAGPFPLVVVNHGASRDRDATTPAWLEHYVGPARWFAAHGFASLLLMRRAYGGSEGDWAESYGSCADPTYDEVGHETARDLRAGVDFVRSRADVDPHRLVLVGHSAGAHGALALASEGLPGLLGVINFAGGRGAERSGHCASERLVATMARYASTTRVPTLWIYAENDDAFRPPLVRRMHEAYVNAGGRADLVMLPPSGPNGHSVFNRAGATSQWGPPVERFLARLGLAPGR
jgi:dienelactone hydrolase